MDGGAWWAAVHGVTKSWTWLSNWAESSIYLLLFFKFIFIWKKIVLQCYIDFCPTTMWTSHNYMYIPSPLEKAMAPHSSTLAWKIPWTEEPGRLQFMGSLRVRHDWATSLSLFTFMHWRRKWQPTPVFLLGEYQGRRSLLGCRLWGRTESDTTEAT